MNRDDAAEAGAAEPIVFLKTPDTVVGPGDQVLIPRRSTKTDYEVELAVVIGSPARYLPSPAEDVELCLWGNGEQRQKGHASDMIFAVDHIVCGFLSQFMVLQPGDVINTGTPAGVAMGRDGTPFLRAGDVVELGIDGLGRQRRTSAQA